LSKALTDSDNYSPLFKCQIAELAAAEGGQAKEGQLMALILESVLQLERTKRQGRQTIQMKDDVAQLQVRAEQAAMSKLSDKELNSLIAKPAQKTPIGFMPSVASDG
jgi:multidrug efflux pump subunit AcrA (membrane-fusion protein)